MLQRALGSGWGLLLAGLIVTGLAYADLSLNTWRMLIVLGLVLTPVMLYHKQLRHFVLLPSGIALVSGMMMLLMNLKRVM
ncbi:MAG: Tryptophan-specific transport protein [Enterobacter kobei]|nr:Tryptophan-specific transport protein [Enterobacter kobei]